MGDMTIKPSRASMFEVWIQSEEQCLFLSNRGLIWACQACILWVNSGLGDNGIRRGWPVPGDGRFPHRLQGAGLLTVPALLA